MTENDNPSNEQNTNDQQTQDATPPAPSALDRITAELARIKKENDEFKAKAKSQEIEAAKAANDWQKIADLKQKEAEEAQEKLERFKKAVSMDKKLSAVREEAIKAGLRKESISDLGYIDYPEVQLDTDNEGNFKVDGADKAIQRLKASRPHWFQSSVPNVNTQSPGVTGSGGKMTYNDIKVIEAEYKKNQTAANAEKLKKAYLDFKNQARSK